MNEMKENIKVGLLAVIAVTLAIATFSPPSGGRKGAPNPNVATAADVNPAASASDITPTPLTPKADEKKPSFPPTTMKFDKMQHDFGDVERESKSTTMFTFTNTGSEPLVIENAKGSCGCTVPKWPKDPILPGKSGEMEVTFDSGKKKGLQNKTVTVTANTMPATTKLTIKANVLVDEEDKKES